MARGRMISQSIAEDIELNEMSLEAQLMYMRTIPFLDRDGLVNGHPSILFGKIAPLLPDILPRMKEFIEEWIMAGLVTSYVDGKNTVLFFKGFTQNQVGMRYDREPESQFAPPPGYVRTKTGLVKDAPQSSGNLPAIFRQSSGNLPSEEKRREEKRSECVSEPETVRQESAPSAPPQQALAPPPKNGRVAHYDPRKIEAGLLTKGTGTTQIEIWRESFAWTPTAAQIRDMNEQATDLDKWRQVTAECAIKAFRSYPNVIDVYLHGWRAPPDATQKQTVSGDIGINLNSI